VTENRSTAISGAHDLADDVARSGRGESAGLVRTARALSAVRALAVRGYWTHSGLYRGPAASMRSMSSGVTAGGRADSSVTGVQTSRNQPSIPDGE